jgi:hypothetical protein
MNNVGLEVFSSEFDKMTAAQVGEKSQELGSNHARLNSAIR